MATWPLYYQPYGYMAAVLCAPWQHGGCITCPVATWQLYYMPCGYTAVVLPALWLHGTCITCLVATRHFYYLPCGYTAVVLPGQWLHGSCITCPLVELRSCVKVEMAALSSPSLTVRAVSVDVKR